MAEQVPLNSELHSVLSAVLSEEEKETETAIFPVSDAKCADYLQFQEVLIGSASINSSKDSVSSSPPSKAVINVIGSSSDMGLEELSKESETAESSQPFCEICAERKENDQMFKIQSCFHSFCSDCIGKHVATKIQGSSSIAVVTCPGADCKTLLELVACRPVLPKPVVDLWEDLLCQELIGSTWQRYYCPFEDCSFMLVNDNPGHDGGEEGSSIIRESECPNCHRLFCAQCSVPWHAGFECEEFKRLNEDDGDREDITLIKLARDKKWRRCPQCRFYVERTQGCPHIVCRCGLEFCHSCGSQWASDHDDCAGN